MGPSVDAQQEPRVPWIRRLSESLLACVPPWIAETRYWAFSATVHLLALLVLSALLLDARPEEKSTVVGVRIGPAARDRYRELAPSRPSPPREVALPPPFVPSERSGGVAPASRGTDLARLTRPMGLAAARSGGASSSAYATRGNAIALRSGGGDGETEGAVRLALDWLARHQSGDGGWRAAGFIERCSKTCTNEHARIGRGSDRHDVGVTGLAMLAFTGAGSTHQGGDRYAACVRRAAEHLKGVQVMEGGPESRGRYGREENRKWIYDHSIATLAMAELLAMTGDREGLARSVEEAVALCLRARNEGGAWRYGYRPGDDDTSVTGWVVLALRAATLTDIPFPRDELASAFRGAADFVRRATEGGITGYKRANDGDNTFDDWPRPYPFSTRKSCMTAVGLLCLLFAGEDRAAPELRSMADVLLRELPRWKRNGIAGPSTINFYHWYYASYALFQQGGEPWSAWNVALKEALLPAQRLHGCERGSWDPIGEWCEKGGRVYSTALTAMTLEVYYRYARER